MKALVAQLGARRHYAVPVALHRAGRLERFFTDLYAGHGLSESCLRWVAKWTRLRSLQHWAERGAAELPDLCVTAFPLFGLAYRWRTRTARTPSDLTAAWMWGGRRFCEHVVSRGFGQADTVLAFTSAALELFRAAQPDGLFCVLDHATAPRLFEDRLTREQYRRYPGLFVEPPKDDRAAEYTERQKAEWPLADLVLCGSRFVQKALVSEGCPEAKTRIVPLGLPAGRVETRETRRRPGPLRVLFAGDDGVRKGVADLIRALELLPRKSFEARIAGQIAFTSDGGRRVEQTAARLGHVARSQMQEQYHWADVFVMPSVSDTFGLVVLEALAAGLPVITTPNTGAADAVRPGVDGFIVPVGAPEAIAEALGQLAGDEGRLRQMSKNALDRFSEFTTDQYGARLVATLESARPLSPGEAS